jgi:hypothetical protein
MVPKIQCAVCNKPVDYIQVDRRADLQNAVQVFVRCHGDNDVFLLDDLESYSVDENSGVAFTTRRIAHDRP